MTASKIANSGRLVIVSGPIASATWIPMATSSMKS